MLVQDPDLTMWTFAGAQQPNGKTCLQHPGNKKCIWICLKMQDIPISGHLDGKMILNTPSGSVSQPVESLEVLLLRCITFAPWWPVDLWIRSSRDHFLETTKRSWALQGLRLRFFKSQPIVLNTPIAWSQWNVQIRYIPPWFPRGCLILFKMLKIRGIISRNLPLSFWLPSLASFSSLIVCHSSNSWDNLQTSEAPRITVLEPTWIDSIWDLLRQKVICVGRKTLCTRRAELEVEEFLSRWRRNMAFTWNLWLHSRSGTKSKKGSNKETTVAEPRVLVSHSCSNIGLPAWCQHSFSFRWWPNKLGLGQAHKLHSLRFRHQPCTTVKIFLSKFERKNNHLTYVCTYTYIYIHSYCESEIPSDICFLIV